MKNPLPLSLFGSTHHKRVTRFLIAAFLGFGFAHSGFSDTVTYEFNTGSEFDATIAGSDVDVSADAIDVSGTISNWGASGTNITPDTDSGDEKHFYIQGQELDNTLDTADYATFTVTANTGSFNVTGASLFARSNNASTNTNFALRSDANGDNFTTDLLTGSESTGAWQSFSNSTIAGITNETSVEFRLYVWGSTGSGETHRYDDISVTVVPEPSTLALIGLAGVAVLIGFRRKG